MEHRKLVCLQVSRKSNINTAFLGLLEQLLENEVVLPATNILRFGRRSGADLS